MYLRDMPRMWMDSEVHFCFCVGFVMTINAGNDYKTGTRDQTILL